MGGGGQTQIIKTEQPIVFKPTAPQRTEAPRIPNSSLDPTFSIGAKRPSGTKEAMMNKLVIPLGGV